jgi:hypothetical protein
MEESREIKAKITELNEKLFKVEERFALGEIDRMFISVYQRI